MAYLGDDGAALRPTLAVVGPGKDRAVLLPVDQVVRGGCHEAAASAVEGAVEAGEPAVGTLDDPGVFDATGPFEFLPPVTVGEEHR